MKLLIAHDGSDGAERRLQDLKRAGLASDLEAVVLTVADVWMPPAREPADPSVPKWLIDAGDKARAEADGAVNQARAIAKRATERLQADFPGWRLRAEACADSPAWAVIKKAEEWQADLTAIGSHGHSAVTRAVLGSVAQKVVMHAPCSVRVCRDRSGETDSAVRLVVGVDGSTGADAAARAVAARHWPAGSMARLITAVDSRLSTAMAHPKHRFGRWVRPDDADERAWLRRMTEAYATELRAAGLAVSSVLKVGDPKQILVQEANRWKADCIFLGASGLTGIERLLLGSVSQAVTARAHCSVEVVRERR